MSEINERRTRRIPFTVHRDILELKLFFRWILPDKEKDFFQNITITRSQTRSIST